MALTHNFTHYKTVKPGQCKGGRFVLIWNNAIRIASQYNFYSQNSCLCACKLRWCVCCVRVCLQKNDLLFEREREKGRGRERERKREREMCCWLMKTVIIVAGKASNTKRAEIFISVASNLGSFFSAPPFRRVQSCFVGWKIGFTSVPI